MKRHSEELGCGDPNRRNQCYSPMLKWAVQQKMLRGLNAILVERDYGIPQVTALNWLKKAKEEIADGKAQEA